ncbi:MAG: DoxX family protein [Candidatus Limnocylindrales bacterium]
MDRFQQWGVGLLRIVVGIIFLWAGTEKVMNGGPSGWSAAGFLGHATGGTLSWPFITGTPAAGTIYNPTHDFWVQLSQNATAMTVVNSLVVTGEVCIGIALILGLFTRFTAICGVLMMLLFFVAAWDFTNGIVNEHLTYAVVVFFLGYIGAGNYLGLDAWLREQSFFKGHPGITTYLLSGVPKKEAPGAVPATA